MRIAIPLMVLALGCGKKDDASGKSEPAPANKTADKASPTAPAENAACKFEITGATTVTIQGPGGPADVTTNYWWKPGDANAESQWPGDKAALIMNCNGADNTSLSMSTRDLTKSTLKLGPQKFDITDDGTVGVFGRIGTKSIAHSKGTLELTAFDTTHVAGKVELTGKLLPDGGEVKVTGQFDFKCPSVASGCGL